MERPAIRTSRFLLVPKHERTVSLRTTCRNLCIGHSCFLQRGAYERLTEEVQAFGADDNYRQLRAVLHVTGFWTEGFEWSAGAGWTMDTDDRSGAYCKIGVLTRR